MEVADSEGSVDFDSVVDALIKNPLYFLQAEFVHKI